MENLKDILLKISNEFLQEAKNALTVISDMAVMEKYIAESYDNRILIELLQNADDSKATKVQCYIFNDYFIFANNGREFNEDDVVSISRSGASKKTKEFIGFRGIGFKSVVSFTNEILIYSNNTVFAFSKNLTAKELNLPANKIPTIRIPYYIDKASIDSRLLKEIEALTLKGYSSIFVFKASNLKIIHKELNELNKNYFLFLNNLEEYYSESEIEKKEIKIIRDANKIKLTENDSISEWKIISNIIDDKNLKIAVLLKDNKIIPCSEKEHKLSSFLPTLDSSPLACIINANFITDPARKHLQKDSYNYEIMKNAGKLFATEIIKYCNNMENYDGIFSILNSRKSYDEFSDIFFTEFDYELKKYVHNKNLKFFSPEFDLNEIQLFKKYFSISLNINNEDYFEAAKYLSKFTEEEIPCIEILKLLTKEEFINKIFESLYYKILVLGIKKLKIMSLFGNVDFKISTILSFNSKKPITEDLNYVNNNMLPNISLQLTTEEANWFCSQIGFKQESITKIDENKKSQIVDKKTTISKWRSAEQQCIDIEQSFGNKAIYVGNKNLGYDVESTDINGNKRYIEVKLLSSPNGNFALTNNEYTCAHQYGENYYVCLLYIESNKIRAIYINNPLQNIEVEKRVKQYEWFCEKYLGEEHVFYLN